MKRSIASASRYAFIFLFVSLAAACIQQRKVTQQEAPVARELHVVAVHQGAKQPATPDGIGSVVPVVVDRPGARIVLVLSSLYPVHWRVETVGRTRIESITLAGPGAGKSVLLGNVPSSRPIMRPDITGGTYPNGADFRKLADTLPGEYGFKRMSSFSHRFTASAEGLSIGRTLPDEPRLDPDYLTALLANSADLPGISFPANIGGEPGLYSLTGEKVGEVNFVNRRNAVHVPERELVYSLTDLGFAYATIAGGEQGVASPPAALPRISWPVALAWDSKRQRLVGITFGGEGHAYAYDPLKDAWAPAGVLDNEDADSIEYDAYRDRYIVAGWSSGIELFALSPQLQLSRIERIATGRFHGFDDLGIPPVDILHVDQRYIVLGAQAAQSIHAPGAATAPLARIWLYDQDERSVVLTWRKR